MLKQSLERWREFTARDLPKRPYLFEMIPTPNRIDISKLGNDGALSSDTCNSAQKSHRILVQLIENKDGIVHEVECVQHL